MIRNLDKRIELMIPIIDNAILKRASEILKRYFEDHSKAHRLLADGRYERLLPVAGKVPLSCQASLYDECKKRAVLAEKMKPSAFTPHIPKKRSQHE